MRPASVQSCNRAAEASAHTSAESEVELEEDVSGTAGEEERGAVEAAEADVVAAVGELSEEAAAVELLGVRRGVNMEKNFLTPCWPLGCGEAVGEEAEEEEEVAGVVVGGGGCVELASAAVGEVGVSVGGCVSAAAVDAAGLLEPDVNRLNMAETISSCRRECSSKRSFNESPIDGCT